MKKQPLYLPRDHCHWFCHWVDFYCHLSIFLRTLNSTQLARPLWTKIKLGYLPSPASSFIQVSWFTWRGRRRRTVAAFVSWIVVIVFIHEINVVRFISIFLLYSLHAIYLSLFPFLATIGPVDDDWKMMMIIIRREFKKYIDWLTALFTFILCTTWANTCKHNEGALILFGGGLFDQCLYRRNDSTSELISCIWSLKFSTY